jgi:DNA-binding transcriptional ArsR family regulator
MSLPAAAVAPVAETLSAEAVLSDVERTQLRLRVPNADARDLYVELRAWRARHGSHAGMAWPSIARLAEILDKSARSISRWLRILKDASVIEVRRQGSKLRRTTNLYAFPALSPVRICPPATPVIRSDLLLPRSGNSARTSAPPSLTLVSEPKQAADEALNAEWLAMQIELPMGPEPEAAANEPPRRRTPRGTRKRRARAEQLALHPMHEAANAEGARERQRFATLAPDEQRLADIVEGLRDERGGSVERIKRRIGDAALWWCEDSVAEVYELDAADLERLRERGERCRRARWRACGVAA